MEGIPETWENLDATLKVGALILAVLTFLFGSGVLYRSWQRWRDRPRLRFSLRQEGLIGSDKKLIFEVSNCGGRATSLYPVVRMKALQLVLTRDYWYPGELVRFLPKRWREGADKVLQKLKVPKERGSTPMYMEYDIRADQPLRLESHCGAREIAAIPRRPAKTYSLIRFRVYKFREEGRRRPHRFYTTYEWRRGTSCFRYWLAWLRYHLFTPPKRNGGGSLEDLQAQKRARD